MKEKADEERIIPLLPNPAITFKRPPRLMHPLSSTYVEKFSSYSEKPQATTKLNFQLLEP